MLVWDGMLHVEQRLLWFMAYIEVFFHLKPLAMNMTGRERSNRVEGPLGPLGPVGLVEPVGAVETGFVGLSVRQ